MKFKDYYATLEVPRDAGADAIRKSYRRLARKYHPDVSKEAGAEERFKELGEAYETLKDPERRAAYDALGQRPAGEDFTAPRDWREQFGAGAAGQPFGDVDLGGIDLADLLDALGRGRGGHPRHAGPRAGQDYDLGARISLEDAHRGTTLELQLQRADGPRTLHVTVPAGVTAGQKLRLRGQGGPGRSGGPAGDIYVHVDLLPHPRYRVDGKDLYFDLPLAPWEAALGAELPVATLDGEVLLTVPAGTHSAQKLRLRGRGLGSGTTRGNLYAVVHIDVPGTLTPRERELFEALAKESRFEPRKNQESRP